MSWFSRCKVAFSAMIATGRKTAALRRRFPNVASGQEMRIYQKVPTSSVPGRARILDAHRGPPARPWRQFGAMTGISRPAFDQG
jgi:predicted transcriptional regulator